MKAWDAEAELRQLGRVAPEVKVQLLYRVVQVGPWRDLGDGPGQEWAVRYSWPDGHVEVQEQESRGVCERLAARLDVPELREVVTRTVDRGEWWLAGAAADLPRNSVR